MPNRIPCDRTALFHYEHSIIERLTVRKSVVSCLQFGGMKEYAQSAALSGGFLFADFPNVCVLIALDV